MSFKFLGKFPVSLGSRLGQSGRGGFRWNQELTFESGNIVTPPSDTWDTTGGVGVATIAITAAAAMRGNLGTQFGIPGDGLARHGQVWGPGEELRGTIECLFDPNSIVMANNDAFGLLSFISGGPGGLMGFLSFGFTIANGYNLQLFGRDDAGANVPGVAQQKIPDDAKQLRVTFEIGGIGQNNGIMQLFINGLLMDTIAGIDNDQQHLSQINCGAAFGVDAGTNGTIYLDNVRWSDKLI